MLVFTRCQLCDYFDHAYSTCLTSCTDCVMDDEKVQQAIEFLSSIASSSSSSSGNQPRRRNTGNGRDHDVIVAIVSCSIILCALTRYRDQAIVSWDSTM